LIRSGTAIDATPIPAPNPIQNDSGTRVPQIQQTKKGNQYFFGMKAHALVSVGSSVVAPPQSKGLPFRQFALGQSRIVSRQTLDSKRRSLLQPNLQKVNGFLIWQTDF
jgi:hypothetical protein